MRNRERHLPLGSANPRHNGLFPQESRDTIPVKDLEDVGIKIVIYPVSLLRTAMGTAHHALTVLRSEGTLSSLVSEMQTRPELYDLLDHEGCNRFDSSIYNFSLTHPSEEPVSGRQERRMLEDKAEVSKGLAGTVADYTAISSVNQETNSLL